MTANAMKGDREDCLAAGMDDYVSKPFGQERIARVLEQWLPKTLQQRQTGSGNPAKTTQTDHDEETPKGMINRTALEAIRNLQSEGNPDILARIVNLYLENTPEQLTKLQRALDTQDAVTLRNIAHNLKSSSANLGAMQLSALCKDLEEKARHNSLMGTTEIVSRIRHVYELVAHELKQDINI